MSSKVLKINKDYLSADNTKCLKGILAVCIVLHHLYSATSVLKEMIIGKLFMFMGYWCVSVFFFITGYGLMTQYKKYRVQYIKHFFRNRIVSFYTICLIGILLYYLYDVCIGSPPENTNINKSDVWWHYNSKWMVFADCTNCVHSFLGNI